MSFRFRRTFSLLPGLRANITKTGASLSIGPRGAKLTVGSGGVRATAGLPGTGMFWSEQVTHKGHADAGQSAEPQLSLPPEVEEVIRERPLHWEFLVLQRALRFASNDINTMAAVSASHGTDAITFHEWISEFIDAFHDVLAEQDAAAAKLNDALGLTGQPVNPDTLVTAVDQFIFTIRSAIVYAQRAAALTRHPLYGGLAAPFCNGVAQPFADVFNEFLQALDDQLPNVDVTHELDLQFKLKSPFSVAAFDAAQDAFLQRFFDSNHNLKTGDVVTERFQIARGEQQLGTFSRAAIADNLQNNIFRQDDWYWSEDAKNWQPLSALVL